MMPWFEINVDAVFSGRWDEEHRGVYIYIIYIYQINERLNNNNKMMILFPQAAGMKNIEGWGLASAPRSDEEILETLDKGFYEESFDPSLHMLVRHPRLSIDQ
jgi:hypothetical protein